MAYLAPRRPGLIQWPDDPTVPPTELQPLPVVATPGFSEGDAFAADIGLPESVTPGYQAPPQPPMPPPVEPDYSYEDRPPIGTPGQGMPPPQPDPYGLNALADRLAPAPQGPVTLGEGVTNVATSVLPSNRALDRAVTGARALQASPAGQAVGAGLGFVMNPVGTTMEAIDPELQRRYEAGARPISQTIAGAGSMGMRAVTTPQYVPEMLGELAQAAKQAAAGDVLSGVGVALRARDKWSIPVATGLLEIFSDPENIAASIGPLAAATDIGNLFKGARAIDDAIASGIAGEADEAVRALRGSPALNPVSEAGQMRLGGLPEPTPPKRLYHGTEVEFAEFDIGKSKAFSEKFGLWFTDDADFAASFGGKVKEADVTISNPKVLTADEWWDIRGEHAKDAPWWAEWKRRLIDQGYDGLRIDEPPTQFAGQTMPARSTFAAFDNTQVKVPPPPQTPGASVPPTGATSGGADEAAEVLSGARPPDPIPPSPPVAEPPKLPSAPEAAKERLFVQTVRDAPDTATTVREALEADPGSYYTPLANKASASAAEELIRTDPIRARAMVYDAKTAPDAVTSSVGQMLIKQAQEAGDFDEAVRLTEAMAARATEAGQFIQALSMYGRLTPEGVLSWAQKVVRQAQDQGLAVAKLTEKQAQKLVSQAEVLQALPEGRERVLQTAELVRNVHELVPPTALRKVSTLQTMAQLLNPKTFIRNVGGNTLFAGLENVSRLIATGLDLPVSLVTGKRSTTLPQFSAQASGFLRGAREGTEEVLRGVNIQQIGTQYDLPVQRVFGDTPVLSQLEKLMGLSLRVPDRAFYQSAFDDSLLSQAWVQAKNEKLAGKALGERVMALVGNPSADLVQQARADALFRTFQDENTATYLFSGLKKILNLGKDFGVGDMVLKYPKTPANLLMRAIEYTPAGFIESASHLAKSAFKKPFNQKAFVESVARATVGTVGLTGMGSVLAANGILTGRSSKDPDLRAQENLQGIGQYRFNVSAFKRWVTNGFMPEEGKVQRGDTWITYDWAQPMAVSVALGAQAAKPTKKTPSVGPLGDGGVLEQVMDIGEAVGEVLAVGLDTLAQQPLVAGVRRALGGENPMDSAINVLKDVPASFAPTVLSQLNQIMDNTMRDPYDPDSTKEALNRFLAKIPIIAASLPPSVDVWGEPRDRYYNDSNNPFNVFVNPSFISQYFPRPEAEMLLELQRTTGQMAQFPRDAPTTLKITQGGQTVNYVLTAEQARDYQVLLGQMTREAFTNLSNNKEFRAAPESEKIDYLAKVLTAVNTEAKDALRARYQERGGAITPLPPPEPKKEGGKEVLNSKNVVDYYKAQKVFATYDAIDDKLAATAPTYAAGKAMVEQSGGVEGLEKQISRMIPASPERIKAFSLLTAYKDGNKAIAERQDQMKRANNYELNDMGLRWGKWSTDLREEDAAKKKKSTGYAIPPGAINMQNVNPAVLAGTR